MKFGDISGPNCIQPFPPPDEILLKCPLIGNIFFDEKFEFLVYLGMILVTFGVVFNILLARDDKKYI